MSHNSLIKSFSLAASIITLSSCFDMEERTGTTSVGNGSIVAGKIEAIFPEAMSRIAYNTSDTVVVFLRRSDSLVDSLSTVDSFLFRYLPAGIYSLVGITSTGDSSVVSNFNLNGSDSVFFSLPFLNADSATPTDSLVDTAFDTTSASFFIQPDPDASRETEVYFGYSGTAQNVGTWGANNGGQKSCLNFSAYENSTIFRTLIAFDSLPILPPRSRVISATLELHIESWVRKQGGDSAFMAAHQVLKPWKEGSASIPCGESPALPNSASIDGATGLDGYWDANTTAADWNKPGLALDNIDASNASIGTTSISTGTLGILQIPISASVVHGWILDASTNHGMLLRDPKEFSSTFPDYPVYSSGEHLIVEQRPALRIVVQTLTPRS